MDEFVHTAFPYIATCLGSILAIMLGLLFKKINRIDEIGLLFNEHLLNFTKIMGTVVTMPNCIDTRRQCLALNEKIIKEPMENLIEALKADILSRRQYSDKRWLELDDEVEQIWSAINVHIHTDKGIVIKGKTHD